MISIDFTFWHTKLEQLRVPPEQTWLQMDNRVVSAISDDLTRLTNVTELRCGGNLLVDIPPAVFVLTRLTQLALHHNALVSVSPEIVRLTGLVELQLNGNRLVSVPREIGSLRALNWLMVGAATCASPSHSPSSRGSSTTTR